MNLKLFPSVKDHNGIDSMSISIWTYQAKHFNKKLITFSCSLLTVLSYAETLHVGQDPRMIPDGPYSVLHSAVEKHQDNGREVG